MKTFEQFNESDIDPYDEEDWEFDDKEFERLRKKIEWEEKEKKKISEQIKKKLKENGY